MSKEPKDQKAPEELKDEALDDAQGGLSFSIGRSSATISQTNKVKLPTGGDGQTFVDVAGIDSTILPAGGVGETPPLMPGLKTRKL